MNDLGTSANKQIGLIPDFFHDIIAFIIPGWMFLVLIAINALALKIITLTYLTSINLNIYLSIVVASYVLGRFFEQIGLITIHYISCDYLKKRFKYDLNPKWSLLFDDDEEKYTKSFKTNAIKKITEWLKEQDSENLINECKESKKDDYFNIIQFYLRERFPAVAMYEKKQNATIILSRSLALIFLFNALILFSMLIYLYDYPYIEIELGLLVAFWFFTQIFFALIFYTRFIKDKYYHAMYIIEAFIATKKLLKSSR